MTNNPIRRAAGLCGSAALLFCLFTPPVAAQSVGSGFLFDATKAEMAGNADWVLDADLHNLDVTNGSGSGKIGGSDSNPQRVPTGAAAGIGANTPESYWTGGLSAWGVALVRNKQGVETLPYNGAITYGSTTNAQDLSHYKVFALVEPNILFTPSEKTALLTFVQNGGGLFLVADHSGSDRNNDGADSVAVLNDLFSNNGVKSNPFGVTFTTSDPGSFTSSFVDTTASNPIIHGPTGTVTQFAYDQGSLMTIDTSKNASVKGAVWSTSAKGSTSVMVAYATYGLGRVVMVGDSSPFDDGTGDTNDTLFDGWDDANGNDARLITNASLWLAAPEPSGPIAVLVGAALLAAMTLCRRWSTATHA